MYSLRNFQIQYIFSAFSNDFIYHKLFLFLSISDESKFYVESSIHILRCPCSMQPLFLHLTSVSLLLSFGWCFFILYKLITEVTLGQNWHSSFPKRWFYPIWPGGGHYGPPLPWIRLPLSHGQGYVNQTSWLCSFPYFPGPRKPVLAFVFQKIEKIRHQKFFGVLKH